ncbi:MAG: DUF2179 domain-containing protein [Balneolaceae bacterium]|nr:DUF2179 domain-containing protein [Balneolaceae bacterium]
MLFDIIPAFWIPVVIFFARIGDVSLGTIRIIFVSRGMKFRVALLGFVEVLIWILVVTQLLQHLDNWVNFVAYAAGFSAGTYLGILLENKLKVGTIIVRVITNEDATGLAEKLMESCFRIIRLHGRGKQGPVEVIFSILKRKRWNEVVNIIESFDTDAFYSVEDVKYSSAGGEGEVPFKLAEVRLTGCSGFARGYDISPGSPPW